MRWGLQVMKRKKPKWLEQTNDKDKMVFAAKQEAVRSRRVEVKTQQNKQLAELP